MSADRDMVENAARAIRNRAEQPIDMAEARYLARAALDASGIGEPIDMMLFCPKCGLQHVDAPDERTPDWTNPPHKSHLCYGCGCIWRPADVPTNGVAAIQTRGAKDTVFYNRAALSRARATQPPSGDS